MTESGHILRVAVTSAGDTTVARFHGEVDVATAEQLTDTIRETQGPIVFELSDVSFMDSSGIRALVEAQGLANGDGRHFAICCPSPAVARVLELINLRGRIPEVASADGAGRSNSGD
jgi:anti-anti-sigma factor